MYDEGYDIVEIREAIDAQYEDTGLEPTPTPMPE